MNTAHPCYARIPGIAFSLALFLLTGFTACDRGSDTYIVTDTGQVIEVEYPTTPQLAPLPICHYDAETNSYERQRIYEKDWPHHARHGDVRLDDEDKDGFTAYNHCDAGDGRQIFDCDDQDGTRYPANVERCDDIDRDCNGDPFNRITRVFDANGQALNSGTVAFGAPVGAVIAAWAVLSPVDACNKIYPPQQIKGKIAIIDPKELGEVPPCPEAGASFSYHALRAQVAGAVGVIICTTTDPEALLVRQADTPKSVTVPVSALSPKACAHLRAQPPGELSIYTRSVCGVPAVPK